MTRLDAFLRNTGIITHRSEAKRVCDAGWVRVDGSVAKPSRELRPGARIHLELPDRILDIEVRAVPAHPVPRAARSGFRRIVREEHRDPYSELEF